MSWKMRSTASSASLLDIVASPYTMTVHRRLSCALHPWSYPDNPVRRFGSAAVAVHGSPYTFSVKPKWRTVIFWVFAARSSAEAYLRTLSPREHSTVGVPKRCEGFMAVWLRVREEFADNRFHLLLSMRYKEQYNETTMIVT